MVIMGQVSTRYRLRFAVLDEDAEGCVDIDLAPESLPALRVGSAGAIPVRLSFTDRQGVVRSLEAQAVPVDARA